MVELLYSVLAGLLVALIIAVVVVYVRPKAKQDDPFDEPGIDVMLTKLSAWYE